MSIEDTLKYSEIFQSFSVGLAAILAGVWAIYRTTTARKIEKSRLELQNAREGLLEKDGVKIDIDFSLGIQTKEATPGFITITLNNPGSRTISLALGDSPLQIGRVVETVSREKKQFYKIDWMASLGSQKAPINQDNNSSVIISKTLYPNSSTKIHFYYPFSDTGIFLLSFNYQMPEDVNSFGEKNLQEEMVKIGGRLIPNTSINRFVQVATVDNLIDG